MWLFVPGQSHQAGKLSKHLCLGVRGPFPPGARPPLLLAASSPPRFRPSPILPPRAPAPPLGPRGSKGGWPAKATVTRPLGAAGRSGLRKPAVGFGPGTAAKFSGTAGPGVREVGAWPEKGRGREQGRDPGGDGPGGAGDGGAAEAGSRDCTAGVKPASRAPPGVWEPGPGAAGPRWSAARWPGHARCERRRPRGSTACLPACLPAGPGASSGAPRPEPPAQPLAGVAPGAAWGPGGPQSRARRLGDARRALRTVRQLQPADARCSVWRQCH